MSNFNVHEWNHKRRLAEIEDGTEEMRSEAVTNLIDAIEEANQETEESPIMGDEMAQDELESRADDWANERNY